MKADFTLGPIVREAARRFGDRIAIVSADGEPISYAELDRRSDHAAVALRTRGVREGSVVALTLPSSPEYVVAYAAVSKLGAVAAGVNPKLTDAERATALDMLRPDEVVAGPIEPEPGEPPDAPAPDPDRVVAIVLTSGTTGAPKGAVFTERQFAAIGAMEGATGGGPMLASTEFAHVGLMTKLPGHLRGGMRVHMLHRWRAADALEVIARERIAMVGGVPAQIALMLREPGFDGLDLSHVRAIVAGGGPSWPSLIREARERFGAPYSVRYSSTESGGLGCTTSLDADDEEALHTVGRARPGIDLEIRDESGRRLPSGEPGEVWLCSPAQMTCYWRDPEATAQTLAGGWLRTGDVGFLDDRGLLHLVGRDGEMFIRGGYNVFPAEVEAALSSHPLVADVAVVPRADPLMGEIGVAAVVPGDPANPPSLEGLRAFASAALAHHKLPEALVIMEELPRNSMHKVDRRRLAVHLADAASANH